MDTITIDEITTGSLDGSGIFDTLMRTLDLHLTKEFNAGRIKGTDYATMYTRFVELALVQASGYAINRAKLPHEIEILKGEQVKTLKEGELIQAQINTENCKRSLELQVLESTVNKSAAELAVTIKQGAKVDADTLRTAAETEQVKYITLHQLPATVAKLEAETLLLPRQVELLEKQVESQENQAELYRLKAVTEKAQTDGSVVLPNSVIYHQSQLYAAQTKSFDQTAKREVARTMIDTFLARLVQDPDGNLENNSNRLTDSDIGQAVSKMLTSIG